MGKHYCSAAIGQGVPVVVGSLVPPILVSLLQGWGQKEKRKTNSMWHSSISLMQCAKTLSHVSSCLRFLASTLVAKVSWSFAFSVTSIDSPPCPILLQIHAGNVPCKRRMTHNLAESVWWDLSNDGGMMMNVYCLYNYLYNYMYVYLMK